MKRINQVQRLQLKLMEQVLFNDCDGAEIVADLIKSRELWDGVVMVKLDGKVVSLIPLRDIQKNQWHVDTLYIIVNGSDDEKMRGFGKKWKAHECGFLSDEESRDSGLWLEKNQRVLWMWWD